VTRLGRAGGARLVADGLVELALADAQAAFAVALPRQLHLLDT
jgi:hypothetical protein